MKHQLDNVGVADLLSGHSISSERKRVCSSGPEVDELDGWQAAVQSGAYALELLSSTYGTRVSCIGSVVKDDRIYPWFYDSTGIVYCTQFTSLISDFELSASLILSFASCSPEQLGYLPESLFIPRVPYAAAFPIRNLTGHRVKLIDERSRKIANVTLQDPLFTAYTLVGRRTFLYTAEASPPVARRPIAVKFSYQATTRAKEQDLVERARNAGVGHLPTIHVTADLWKLSEGIRSRFFDGGGDASDYEDRTLRAIVYTRYASIKTLFAQRCELIPVMVDQMLDCKLTHTPLHASFADVAIHQVSTTSATKPVCSTATSASTTSCTRCEGASTISS